MKHRIETESRSAQLMEDEELALARRKRNEKPKLEAIAPGLDEEATIALAKALAIDYKLPHAPNLPSASPKDCVQEYLDSRLQDLFIPPHDVSKTEDLEQKHYPEPKTETNVKSTEPDCKAEVPFPSTPQTNPNASCKGSVTPSLRTLGRPSAFLPCPNRFHLKQDTTPTSWEGQEATPLIDSPFEDGLCRTVFVRTHDDNKPGTSAEDGTFMRIMENGMVKDRNGSWEAPLRLPCDLMDLHSSRENAMKSLKSPNRP